MIRQYCTVRVYSRKYLVTEHWKISHIEIVFRNIVEITLILHEHQSKFWVPQKELMYQKKSHTYKNFFSNRHIFLLKTNVFRTPKIWKWCFTSIQISGVLDDVRTFWLHFYIPNKICSSYKNFQTRSVQSSYRILEKSCFFWSSKILMKFSFFGMFVIMSTHDDGSWWCIFLIQKKHWKKNSEKYKK